MQRWSLPGKSQVHFTAITEANEAQENFVTMFQKKDIPDDMPSFPYLAGQKLIDVLIASELVGSKGEARRLIQQNGVKLDGEILTDPFAALPHAGVLQVGKRHFTRVE